MSADLANAINSIFIHPNVGPFIAKQLIQKLVTSNPSPQYVQRVASVFNDNGAQHVRGDLKAVVRAILLDSEARGPVKTDVDYGRLREPAQYAVARRASAERNDRRRVPARAIRGDGSTRVPSAVGIQLLSARLRRAAHRDTGSGVRTAEHDDGIRADQLRECARFRHDQSGSGGLRRHRHAGGLDRACRNCRRSRTRWSTRWIEY